MNLLSVIGLRHTFSFYSPIAFKGIDHALFYSYSPHLLTLSLAYLLIYLVTCSPLCLLTSPLSHSSLAHLNHSPSFLFIHLLFSPFLFTCFLSPSYLLAFFPTHSPTQSLCIGEALSTDHLESSNTSRHSSSRRYYSKSNFANQLTMADIQSQERNFLFTYHFWYTRFHDPIDIL